MGLNLDGIARISDNHQCVCLGLSLLNGEDSILKERLRYTVMVSPPRKPRRGGESIITSI